MRFTKIPLIATLMAVALSLLIVLPTLAQTADITDGKLSSGVVTAGVFANIGDAELDKLRDAAAAGLPGGETGAYVPVATEPPTPANNVGEHEASDRAHLVTPEASPQDTLFRNTLYVSNDGAAYNTILINVASDLATCDTNDATRANVTASVKNNRSGRTVTLQLVQTDGADDNVQGFIKVVEDGATGTLVDGTNTAVQEDGEDVVAELREFGGPTWCDNDETRSYDANDPPTPNDPSDDTTGIEVEVGADGALYGPVAVPGEYGQPVAATGPPTTQEIATIFAEHGDRLTITTTGGSGVIELVVDGDGPEFTAVTPEDNTVTRPSRLTFSFEVRDDDSGLRHDGESVTSNDGDLEEVNPDGDHNLHNEPLSVDPGTAVSANGRSADIDVKVVVNPRTGAESNLSTSDISASGTWSMAGSRPGVAYAFSASGADRGDAHYLYQLEATDRAGNTSMTDAESGTDAAEPYVFRVDDEDPALIGVRTGISWSADDDAEEVDRSYVALTFTDANGADALGDVDTDNITVVGHTIVGVIHPSERPVINRNTPMATMPAAGDSVEPKAPATVAMPSVSVTGTLADGTTEYTLTPSASCSITSVGTTPTSDEVIAATIAVIATSGLGTGETDPAVAYCALWTTYQTYLNDLATYNTKKTAFDNYNQYKRENPGEDIEGNSITEPRARVYLELSEDLAADAEPDVVVVGGAVFDLAGNTNEADTVEAVDWIAPSLTVTVTGTANDRPVVNDEGSFSIDVQSDEDLRRRPVVFFVEINADEDDDGELDGTYSIAMADEASPLTQQEDENHWARKYRRSSIEIDLASDESGKIIGVVVLGHDGEDNSGATAGWTVGDHRNAAEPRSGNGLNLTKMDGAGLLVEIDEQFNNKVDTGIGEVTPRSDDDGEETESANPFVKLTFGGEDDEYEIAGFDDGDSHDTVTVTEITLNGENVMAHLNRVSATEFSLVLRDLAVDSYEVEFVAEDEAGNEMDDGSFTFDVNERQPYEIEVQPGWNLVSLPATPLEPAIADVLASNQYISPVLGYQEGDWITAIREDDGTWRGRLTEIIGGYGYWVHARTFESISTMLSEVDPAGVLPTVPVTAGWNLLGVLDIFQNAAAPIDKAEPPGEKDAEGNFA
ncbi:MAG: hypothetical protein F4X83_06585, partial [Chloroflexi bacterium]|nr:hypothetical protein [Chloroflexota bacterium]